jgi:predicted PurR-regulated permease PerM
MRIILDKAYLKISGYTILTATILYILYAFISNLGSILKIALLVLGVVFSVLSPVIIALVIAYLLHPLVTWIDTNVATKISLLPSKANKSHKYQHLRRTASVLLTYLLFLSLILLFIYSLYVLISGSLPKNLSFNNMMIYISNYSNTYNELFDRLISTLQTSGISDNMKNQLLALIKVTQNFISNGVAGLFTSIQEFGNNLLNIMLGFVIAFYLLKDVEYFRNLYHDSTSFLFNRKYNEKLSGILADINGVVSKFIRGQLLVALIVGILSSIGLYAVGLDYAVLVGMTAGLGNIIPYFGPIVGAILAVIVGLISGSPLKALFSVLVLIVVQQLESIIISPKIVGDSVGLHPVFVMLSVVIGGTFFGLMGMLIAVPIAGIIKLFLNQWVAYTRQSDEM